MHWLFQAEATLNICFDFWFFNCNVVSENSVCNSIANKPAAYGVAPSVIISQRTTPNAQTSDLAVNFRFWKHSGAIQRRGCRGGDPERCCKVFTETYETNQEKRSRYVSHRHQRAWPRVQKWAKPFACWSCKRNNKMPKMERTQRVRHEQCAYARGRSAQK